MNVRKHQPNNVVSHPRRPESLMLLWKPYISHETIKSDRNLQLWRGWKRNREWSYPPTEHGDSRYLWNIGTFPLGYTLLYPGTVFVLVTTMRTKSHVNDSTPKQYLPK